MIDVERAGVDLRINVKRLRFYLQKLSQNEKNGILSPEERILIKHFRKGAEIFSDEVRRLDLAVHKRIKGAK